MRYVVPKQIFINKVKFFITRDVQNLGLRERAKKADLYHRLARDFFMHYLRDHDEVVLDKYAKLDHETMLLTMLNQQRLIQCEEKMQSITVLMRAIQLTCLTIRQHGLYERDRMLVKILREKTGFMVKEPQASQVEIIVPLTGSESSRRACGKFAKSLEYALNHRYDRSHEEHFAVVELCLLQDETYYAISISDHGQDALQDERILQEFCRDILDIATLVETDQYMMQAQKVPSGYEAVKIMHDVTGIARHRYHHRLHEFGQWNYLKGKKRRAGYLYTELHHVPARMVEDITDLLVSEAYVQGDKLYIPLTEIIPLKERMALFEDERQQLRDLFQIAQSLAPHEALSTGHFSRIFVQG